VDAARRRVLSAACLGGLAGRARATPAGTVEVDLATIEPGTLKSVAWNGRPVWVLRRSPSMLQQLQAAEHVARLADPHAADDTPPAARNAWRSVRPEVFVAVALCPHAGCVPTPRLKPGPRPAEADNWPGGFACPCHFATFDLAGRVFKGKPTQRNLEVPPHAFAGESTVVIGRDSA
jgi:ubiquinol-cytochrome c reductase iron-sulfur subunit